MMKLSPKHQLSIGIAITAVLFELHHVFGMSAMLLLCMTRACQSLGRTCHNFLISELVFIQLSPGPQLLISTVLS